MENNIKECLPLEKGIYLHFFLVDNNITINIRNTRIIITTGIYAYVGSSMGSGGIKARVVRHLRRRKKVYWHIDRITTSSAYTPLASIYALTDTKYSEYILSLLMYTSRCFTSVDKIGGSDNPYNIGHLFKCYTNDINVCIECGIGALMGLGYTPRICIHSSHHENSS